MEVSLDSDRQSVAHSIVVQQHGKSRPTFTATTVKYSQR